jgi:hypothetical protein
MRKTKLAVLQFVFAFALTMLAISGMGIVALDMYSTSTARYGQESPKIVRLKAASPGSSSAAFTQPAEVLHYSDQELRKRVLVTFTAYKLLAGDGTLAGDLKLKVPDSLKEEFEPQPSELVSCPENRNGRRVQPKVEEEYADKTLRINVLNETGSPSVKIPIPLEDFLSSSIRSGSDTCEEKEEDIINRPAEFRIPAELPVLAGPTRQYPSDYHQLSANVQIRMPKGFSLPSVTQEGDVSVIGSSPAALPHAIRIRSSQGMEGRTIALFEPGANIPLPRSLDVPRIAMTKVDTTVSPANPQIDVPSQDDVDLRLLLVRDSSTRYFVYLVAFLLPPMLLLALVLVPSSSGRAINFTDITVNLAVATLAILPLRAVLVPPDLHVLTRIDYILLFQLVLIIAVAFLLNGLTAWQDTSGEAAQGGGNP